MPCPSYTDLLDYAAQRLDDPTQKAVQDHYRSCPHCARQVAELQGLWSQLGIWQPVTPGTNLARRVLAAAEEFDRPPRLSPADGLPRPGWGRVAESPWRLAALLLLTAGVGLLTGWLIPLPSPHLPTPASRPVNAVAQSQEQAAVVHELDLDVFSGQAMPLAHLLSDPPERGDTRKGAL